MTDVLEVYDINNNVVQKIGDEKSRTNTAAEFSTSQNYAVGDYCLYDGILYRFTSAHSAGTWNSSHVIQVNLADDKVKKSGDTMTGDLEIAKSDTAIIKLSNSQITEGTAPANNQVAGSIYFNDGNNKSLGYIANTYTTAEVARMGFVARQTVSGTGVYNMLVLTVASDGTKTVEMTDPSAWRSALQLGDSGWKTLTNNTVFTGTIYYRKVWKIVEVMLDDLTLANSLTANTWLTLATIPSGYRPSKIASNAVNVRSPSNYHGVVMIETNGAIKFASQDGSWATGSNYLFTTLTYLVD